LLEAHADRGKLARDPGVVARGEQRLVGMFLVEDA
jgi:hypothetical protein